MIIAKRATASIGLTVGLAALLSAHAEEAAPVFDDKKPLTVTAPHEEEPALAAARARVRETVDGFLEKLGHPTPGTELYAVKLGIRDTPSGGFAIVRPGRRDTDAEYFWIGDIRPDQDGFTGAVHSYPETVRNIAPNQRIHFTRDQIADWAYLDHGAIKGSFTACVFLAHSPEELQKLEARGLKCE